MATGIIAIFAGVLAEAPAAADTVPDDGGNAASWIPLIAGVALIIFVLTRRRLLNKRKSCDAGADGSANRLRAAGSAAQLPQPRRKSSAGNTIATLSHNERHELGESMQQLMLDLEEMSRQVGGQIDTRLRALNLLIQEADDKIAELRRLGLAGPKVQSTDHTAQPPAAQATDDNSSAEQAGDVPAATDLPPDDKYAQVYALAASGRSVIEIAQEMEMMTGEVELILALQRSAATHPAAAADRSEGAS